MNSEREKALVAWAKEHAGWQDEKRMLVCLLKMRLLETVEQFAQRVWQAWQEHEAKHSL